MIALGSDHAGDELKQHVKKHLDELGVEYIDLGFVELRRDDDYPVIAKEVAKYVQSGKAEKGMLFCGTGIGMSMAANKLKGIRAACCSDVFSAKYTRLHNDANVLCLGARVVGVGLAIELADVFVDTGFEGGKHQRRIDMIAGLEK